MTSNSQHMERRHAAEASGARPMRAPANPGLEPRLLRSRAGTRNVFPFSAERQQWYLLARGALWHGLEAMGLGAGDRVLAPAYNHGVEIDTLMDAGLDVAYYGIDRRMAYDVDEIRRRVDGGTRAVYVIHYFGFPQPIGPLRALCDELGLKLIEDCALSLFARSEGASVGRAGDFSLFCLHKTLGLPHGGILAINRPDVEMPRPARRPPLALATHGLKRRASARLEIDFPWLASLVRRAPMIGDGLVLEQDGTLNARMTGWEDYNRDLVRYAATGPTRYAAERASPADVFNKRRENYRRIAATLPPSRLLWEQLPDGACPLFVPLLADEKQAMVRFLLRRGVEAVPVWLEAHASIPQDAFPDSEYLRQHVVELPCHQDIDRPAIDLMSAALAEAFESGL